jgi:hypothetical protein
MKNWFSNLGKATQVATAVITFVTLGGLLWVGYGKLTDWIGPDAKKETPWLGLQVWQDGAPNDIFVMGDDELERKVEVPMARKPFQIRLPQLEADSGIHICAWTDDSIFEAKSPPYAHLGLLDSHSNWISFRGAGHRDSDGWDYAPDASRGTNRRGHRFLLWWSGICSSLSRYARGYEAGHAC